MGISVFPAASAAPIRKSQTFTSSGTFTLPSGYGASKPLFVEMEVCGGGGGGGSGSANTANNAAGGGGGGSGVTTFFTNVQLTANATVTIGAGGTGGTAVSGTTNGNDGTYGGSSNVNSTYYSPGGGYGGGAIAGAAAASYGAAVISNGYSISAAYNSSATGGLGGSGGSGGAFSISLAANPSSNPGSGTNAYYRGGVYGLPGHFAPAEPSGGGGVMEVALGNGYGLAFNAIGQASFTTATTPLKPDLLQRGGGGGGGHGTTSGTYGLGGGAGTKTSGGLSGIRAQTAGDKNGASATDPGCGGGGGGGGYNVSSGAGGNGAAGYVTIYWWE